MARNVILQVIDEHLLLIDHRFYQVTNGDDADNVLVIEDGQMPGALVGHQRHALVDSLRRVNAKNPFCHDF